jgi:hypothetical protein
MMSRVDTRPYQPYPWPWGQPSILTSTANEKRQRANFWLDSVLPEEYSSDSDYTPSDGSDSDETSSSESASEISESELADIDADAQTGWPTSPTPSEKAIDDREDLARQVAELVKAEEDAAAAYNPDQVVALVTELYELFVTMGHWSEGSLQYPPHTETPVNEKLAEELGYAPAAISLMTKLPYVGAEENWKDQEHIVSCTRLADYTCEEDLREGRRPYPYQYRDGCPDIDPWLLPLALPYRYGYTIMLDTTLGVIRAYSAENFPPRNTIEWRRHGEVPDDELELDRASWTEYRRAPLVPAARYLSEVIYAYRSLSRLPLIHADYSDHAHKRYVHPGTEWLVNEVTKSYTSRILCTNLFTGAGAAGSAVGAVSRVWMARAVAAGRIPCQMESQEG